MITVKSIGYHFLNFTIDVQRPSGSGDFLFLFFRNETEVFLENKYQKVPENTFMLFKKGMPQIYRKLDGAFINDWIHFDIEPYEDFFEKLDIPFNTPIKLSDSKIITDLIGDLHVEFFNAGKQHETIMHQKTSVLFHKFSDVYRFTKNSGQTAGKYYSKLNTIRSRLLSYQYVPQDAKEIAKTLNISISYLQHIYKGFFGVSLQQDIISGRIACAKHLLTSSDMTITEISKVCGYENLEHFSRQFKKHTGSSPKEYRIKE